MSHTTIRAIVVDASAPYKLAIREVGLAPPRLGEVKVSVTALSLNRGEVRVALERGVDGDRPGWDFAGVVEDVLEAPNAPPVGTRVVGLLPTGAWAQQVHADPTSLAVIPGGVDDLVAVALPVAALTALHALRRGGLLLGRRVLVDGATGGVGHFAIQLAAAAGAEVFGHARRLDQKAAIAKFCTGGVIVSDELEEARKYAPYDLILDSVGGSALGSLMTMLAPRGTCITFGSATGEPVRFDGAGFFRSPGVNLQSLMLLDAIAASEPAGKGLDLLLRLVADGRLRPDLGLIAPWTDVGVVAHRLMARAFVGKAVLRVS